MEQKLLTRLILGAFAGIVAAGTAQAGQITASSTTIAREVIVDDTQTIVSPSISYRFAGDIDASMQDQEFQVQFILQGNATWSDEEGIATVGLPTPDAFTITPTTLTIDNLSVSPVPVGVGGAPGITTADFEVSRISVDASKKILWATITIRRGLLTTAANWTGTTNIVIGQPIISLNANSAGSTRVAGIDGLYALVGNLVSDFQATGDCTADKKLGVEFRHFKALISPNDIAGVGNNGSPDEHGRAGATNTSDLMVFPTNLKINVVKSFHDTTYRGARLDPATGNTSFAIIGGATGAALPLWGATPPVQGTGAYISPTAVNLGLVHISQNATGYDAGLTAQYMLADPATLGNMAANAANVVGAVEARRLEVKISATAGFQLGSRVYLSDVPNCAGATYGTGVTITSANAAGPITVNTGATAAYTTALRTPGVAATAPVYVCYAVAPTPVGPIPGSVFTAEAKLVKAPNGAAAPAFNNEQDNICAGPLYPLGGGVKIDVRNYASSANAQGGWQSVIRLINNSEIRTIDVYGQIIHPDGKYGPWGKIATLEPRAVKNMPSTVIDPLLVNAPSAGGGNDGSASAQPYTDSAPRLRITSDNGVTLRVQNYMLNPATGDVMEFSSAQGVDFEGTDDRAPVNEGQYISQDAAAGINGR